MPYYAQLNEAGVCVAVTATARPAEAGNMVELQSLDSSLLGSTYSVETGVFTPPAPVVVRHISRLAFLARFTDAEAIGIDLASIGATVEAAAMRRYLNKVNAAKHIDLEMEDTVQGVQAIEAAGLLAPGRAAQILGAEIHPSERP